MAGKNGGSSGGTLGSTVTESYDDTDWASLDGHDFGVKSFQDYLTHFGGKENYEGDFADTIDNFDSELSNILTPEEMEAFDNGEWENVPPLLYMWERFTNEDGTVMMASTRDNRSAMEQNTDMTPDEIAEYESELRDKFYRDFVETYFVNMDGDRPIWE